ncbi:hypothetical protein Tco_1405026 [Tanacetum coccineum]
MKSSLDKSEEVNENFRCFIFGTQENWKEDDELADIILEYLWNKAYNESEFAQGGNVRMTLQDSYAFECLLGEMYYGVLYRNDTARFKVSLWSSSVRTNSNVDPTLIDLIP